MKKVLVAGLALGFVLTAGSAMATIVGSKHDLSVTGASASLGNDAQERICVYCHHPHNSVKANPSGTGINDISYSPLWNREYRADRDNDGVSDFVPYNNGVNMSSGTGTSVKHMMNGKPAVGGISLLCLSCHDGVTAMSAYSSNNPAGGTGSVLPFGTPSNPTDVITGVAALGTDLSNHHPIGMSWDEVTASDDEIAQKSDTFNNTSITIGSVLTGGDTMECAACHDVHNTNVTGRNNAERFLWTSNNNSQFCLSCHLK